MLEYKEIGLGGIRTSAITDQGWQTVRHDRAAVRPDRPEGGADRSRSIARQDRREIYPGRYQTGHERQYVTQLFQTAIVSVFTGGPMAVWRFAIFSILLAISRRPVFNSLPTDSYQQVIRSQRTLEMFTSPLATTKASWPPMKRAFLSSDNSPLHVLGVLIPVSQNGGQSPAS